MSWRFRKSFKIMPGVKLNLTRHGLSATLGAAPFSLNVGPRGVYSNVSIPGTGIWDRQRLDSPPSLRDSPSPAFDRANPPQLPLSTPGSVSEIRSASTELLKSQSMADLQKLLEEAYEERSTLSLETATASRDNDVARSRYQSWEKGFLFKRVFPKFHAARKDIFDTAQAKFHELREQLRLTVLATQIDIDREQAEPYYKMRDEFAALCQCQRTWDTLQHRAVDRIAERSTAYEAITRESVGFALDCCDLIQWEQKVLHLPNRTGGDLYIYPGFVLYRAGKQAFAIIDSREVHLTYRPERFIEDGPVPSDAQIVGRAWAKSNKDGSPDRRFRDNHQIPIVLYGSLTFTSSSGLHEEFQSSNSAPAERFAKAWNLFQASFAPAGQHGARGTEKEVANGLPIKPLDPKAAFAGESDRARSLALQQGEFWEFLLTEELLRSKLPTIEKEYSEFDQTLLLVPKKYFTGREFVNWLGEKTPELTFLIERMARCVDEKLPDSWGKRGESGDAIQILTAVDEIIDGCRTARNWELDICSAEPPVNLKRLGASLRGTTSFVIDDVKSFLTELSRAIESFRMGERSLQIHLVFSTPPQIASLAVEMEKVSKHPEWLVS
jgi:hypothetical protein